MESLQEVVDTAGLDKRGKGFYMVTAAYSWSFERERCKACFIGIGENLRGSMFALFDG